MPQRPRLESDRCTRCEGLVRMAFTERNEVPIALDFYDTPDGSVFLGRVRGDNRVLARMAPEVVQAAKDRGEWSSIFMPHRATCRAEQRAQVPA
jgi:hypothetical protein